MKKSNFHLNKWYLDYTGNRGETIICYAAKLTWFGFSLSYVSYIRYGPGKKVKEVSHYRGVNLPDKQGDFIKWSDDKLGIQGSWESSATGIESRIYDGENGHLDWHCFQPCSKVSLKIEGKILKGLGYAEQLILTVPPWQIPMAELRWGRFHSSDYILVWIEIRKEVKKDWVWLNGERLSNCEIEDHKILLNDKSFTLKLDRKITLESEKKIQNVVNNIIRYIPGFKNGMSLNFLKADSYKWLSTGILTLEGDEIIHGNAIHEWVNFNSEKS